MIAAKYLMSFDPHSDERLFETEVLWNIRPTEDGLTATFDDASRVLSIPNECKVTVPDSGHRHFGMLEVNRWMRDTSLIPRTASCTTRWIQILTVEQIEELLLELKPKDPEVGAIMLKIYALPEEDEGRCFTKRTRKASR